MYVKNILESTDLYDLLAKVLAGEQANQGFRSFVDAFDNVFLIDHLVLHDQALHVLEEVPRAPAPSGQR